MLVLRLVVQSLWNRRLTSGLTCLSIVLSVTLLLTVERVRLGARESFANTISQTDLIVGAKGGTLQLLLYTVFRMGSATDNMSFQSYQEIAAWDEVAWTIPFSLGDSHRGYRVVGTDANFYKHYQYRRARRIAFRQGHAPKDLFHVALGSLVARELRYKVGQKIVLSHGVASVSLQDHEDKPFEVVGILKPTGTAVDRSLYVTLEGIEALHMDWADGAPPMPGDELSADQVREKNIRIGEITSFLLGAKTRLATLSLQRSVSDFEEEALMAIIPGVALSELWQGLSYAEDGLRAVSMMVVFVGLLGMIIAIYTTLAERRREMAILRSVGAGPGLILSLLVFESVLLTILGCLGGVLLSYFGLWLCQAYVEEVFGLFLPLKFLYASELIYLGLVLATGFLLGCIPAWRAYRNTLQDGLTLQF